jgi:hypothetical protein
MLTSTSTSELPVFAYIKTPVSKTDIVLTCDFVVTPSMAQIIIAGDANHSCSSSFPAFARQRSTKRN